jgi:hypothetical protein
LWHRIAGRRRFVMSALGRQRDGRRGGRFGGRGLRWREAIVYDHGEWLVVDRRGWLGRRQLGRDRRAGLDGLRLLREGLRLRRGADDRLHNAGFPGEHECRHGSGTAAGSARQLELEWARHLGGRGRGGLDQRSRLCRRLD